LGDDGLLIAVGDVSGKGLKAAMLVSMIIGTIQGRRLDPLGNIMSEVNRVLCGRTDGGFVTCVCIRLYADGRFEMANAGHPAPWVDGRESNVPGGLPLGIDPSVEWNVTSGVMDANSGFMFASDGIIEAANTRGELFGFERTAALSRKAAGEVADAAKAWGQNDDITVVTVRRAEPPRRTAA
jgi:serine phosphatase RsbU (regulator of sigma subunit)